MSLVRPAHSKCTSTNSEQNKVYIVERILKYRWIKKKRYARIKWKGYPYRESSWEPVDSIFRAHTEHIVRGHNDHVQEVEKIDGKRQRHGKPEYRVLLKGIKGPKRIKWLSPAEIPQKELIDSYEEILIKGHTVQKTSPAENDVIDESQSMIFGGHVAISDSTELPTSVESAVKLELSIPSTNYKPIDRWTPEEVRDYLSSLGFVEEAAKLYGEAIDGGALCCINNATIICQCGILLGPALKLFRVVKKMQTSNT